MLGFLVGSMQSKVMIGVSMLALIVTQVMNFSLAGLVGHMIMTVGLAYNATCLSMGGCNIWSWVTLAVPILLAILSIVSAARSVADDD